MTDSDSVKQLFHQGTDRSLVILFVQGEDSREYLQRMVSCDVRKATPEQGCRGTLLDGKGRILAAFDLLEISGGYLMVTSEIESGVLKSRLESLVILEDVTIQVGRYHWFHLHGEGAENGAQQLGWQSKDSFLSANCREDLVLVKRPRFHPQGFDILVKEDRKDEFLNQISEMAEEASEADREKGRILLGLPKTGAEIGPRTLPPEVGYEDAVAYDKGCYAGQEVLARIRTYVHVNREIRRVELVGNNSSGKQPEVGDELWPATGAEKPVGQITSVTKTDEGWAAIASIRYRYLSQSTEGDALIWNPGGEPELQGHLKPVFSTQI